MKALNIVIPLILMALAAGCKSDEARTVSNAGTSAVSPQVTQTLVPPQTAPVSQQPATNTIPQQIVTDKAVYTIKVLPNPRLSPTSREGDKTNEVYSSNIIAVYVQPRNGATVNSTNSPAVPGAGNNAPAQNK